MAKPTDKKIKPAQITLRRFYHKSLGNAANRSV